MPGHAMAGQIHADVRIFEDLLFQFRMGAAQYRLDTRNHLAWRIGFYDIVVRTGFEAPDAVVFFAARGQHNDRERPSISSPKRFFAASLAVTIVFSPSIKSTGFDNACKMAAVRTVSNACFPHRSLETLNMSV